jgi:nitrite reductase (NADH) small subunit
VYFDVGALEDMEEAKATVAVVEGREIGLVRWGDEIYAMRNICPHQFGPVCAGYTMPLIGGESAGALTADPDRPVVICPWHGWEFDARTGQAAWGRSRYKLKVYDVKIEDGRVLVDVGATRSA